VDYLQWSFDIFTSID